MITFEKYKESYFEALKYTLNEEQASFTSDIDYCVNERKDTKSIDKQIVVIVYENQPVGFFVMDFGNDKYTMTENPTAVLLRSFSVNPSYQGRGIGGASVLYLADFVKSNFPQVEEIVLAVNLKNTTAYDLYIKSEFVDEGKIIEGRKGFQHVLTRKIH